MSSEGARRAFGPYEVICPLGAGGMGEVFKARDTRLDRVVALKTSREQFTDRFQREARVVAALNHPHIAALYDVGPEYLVMEYVEGEVLRGPLPIGRALLFARQILEALEAAHAKGIVHRDLKPANVMVAKSGVKLLDFGLAQMKAPVAAPAAGDRTATMALTAEGTIAGTLQYMAPEQLQGKQVDARSDLFAFGAVLYEMLTGQKAFSGDNAASVISAVMASEPRPIAELQPGIPTGIGRVIGLCLKKDPEERWQSAADIRHALDLVEVESPTAAAAVPRSHGGGSWWAAAAFAAGVALAALGFRYSGPKEAAPPTFRPLTYSGRAYLPALSPDGKQVAYVWSGEKENGNDLGMYVQLVSGGNPLPLKEVQPRGKVAWSEDGSQLAFSRNDGLYVMPALGGSRRKVASLPNGANGSDVAWAPNGAFFVVASERSELTLISGDGASVRDLTHPKGADDHSPAIAPGSDAVAFVRHTSTYNSQLLVQSVGSDGAAAGEPKQITSGVWDIERLDWTPDGKSLVFSGSKGSNNFSLWRIARGGGEVRPMLVPNRLAAQPSVARRSGRVAYGTSDVETKIYKMPLGGGAKEEPKPLVEAIGQHGDLAVSGDGSRIAFAANRTGSKEIWIANADGSGQTQLTSFNGPAVGSPRWSPDGKWITFDGYASGSSDVYVIATDGGKPVQLTKDPANEIRPSWSHDGKWIYYSTDKGKEREIWKIPAAGGQAVRVTPGYNAFETADGKWLYVLRDSGKLVCLHPDGSGEVAVAGGGVSTNFWTIGGKNVWVYDLAKHTLWKVGFGGTKGEKAVEFGKTFPEPAGICFGMPLDESYLIFRQRTREVSGLMLMEGFR
jgi:Tol biopolymer transport system component